MPAIGKWNQLEILRECDHGLILEGKELGELLLPKKYVYEGCEIGTTAQVFVYPDSSDRLIATTETPLAQAGEFAYLNCVDSNRIGAFFDMGLAKDLLVPFAEQNTRINKGYSYIIYLSLDEVSQRLIGSSKLHKFLSLQGDHYFEDQEVEILAYEETEYGYKVIVNGQDRGMIYHNEIFQPVSVGSRLSAYVYLCRPDGKLDLCLQLPAERKVTELQQRILDELSSAGGSLPLSDKSSAAMIESRFQCSKKTFKRALGALYKKKAISIHPDEIQLTKK